MFSAAMLLCASSLGGECLTARDLSPFASLDAAVRQLPAASPTVAGVAKSLGALATSPLDRARAAYDWTSAHIAYSLDRRHDAAAVMSGLSGDCDAHALVYAALCKALGVECQIVGGGVRYGVAPPASLASVSKPLGEGQWLVAHAWNAIRIDGRWGLVDTTMGVSAGAGAEPDDYFLIDPAVFAVDHVPDDAAMRFVDAPADLVHAPFMRPFAWRSGLDLESVTADVEREEGRIFVRPHLAWCKGMRAAFQTADGSVPDRVLVQPTDKGTEILLCPSGGASVTWLGQPGGGRWRPLVGYPFLAPAASLLPKVMTGFYDSGAFLAGPFDRDLSAGKPAEIRLRAPGASQVVAFQGPDVAGTFDKVGNTWVLHSAPTSGAKLEVMASYDDPDKYQGLLTYDVH